MKLRSLGRTHPPCSAAKPLLATLIGVICLGLVPAAMAQAAPGAPVRVQRGAEANLLVLEVRLEGHVLSDSFVAYQDDGHILLPLGELSRLLTLAITVQPERGAASGFVVREERTFGLRAADGVVSLEGHDKGFDPRLAQVIGDDVYVSSRLLARWLPVDLEIDLGRLQLIV